MQQKVLHCDKCYDDVFSLRVTKRPEQKSEEPM